jgi:hypothetical protein
VSQSVRRNNMITGATEEGREGGREGGQTRRRTFWEGGRKSPLLTQAMTWSGAAPTQLQT